MMNVLELNEKFFGPTDTASPITQAAHEQQTSITAPPELASTTSQITHAERDLASLINIITNIINQAKSKSYQLDDKLKQQLQNILLEMQQNKISVSDNSSDALKKLIGALKSAFAELGNQIDERIQEKRPAGTPRIPILPSTRATDCIDGLLEDAVVKNVDGSIVTIQNMFNATGITISDLASVKKPRPQLTLEIKPTIFAPESKPATTVDLVSARTRTPQQEADIKRYGLGG